jgi:hypothetical protein
MKNKTLWKFLRTGLVSDNGEDKQWKLGEWRKENKELKICKVGFHASETPLQAFRYIKGEILAQVKCRGESIIEDDKECWSEMKIIKAYHWTKEDSVELAIFSAELAIDIYEKQYPNDNRPRKTIEAAKNYLKVVKNNGDIESARSAADSAAESAWNAAWSAESARNATIKKIDDWFITKVETLKVWQE